MSFYSKVIMLISNIFGNIGFKCLNISKSLLKYAYYLQGRICAEDDVCLHNSIVPFYKKNKVGKRLVEFATAQDEFMCGTTKVGTLGDVPKPMVKFPITFESVPDETLKFVEQLQKKE